MFLPPKLDSGPPSETEAGTVPRFGGIEVSVLGWILTVLSERGFQMEEGTEDWPCLGSLYC